MGHNRWAAQNVVFEEVPGAEMVVYPNDWDNDAIWLYVLNDFGDIRPAVNDWSDWTIGVGLNVSSVTGNATVGGDFDVYDVPLGVGTTPPLAGTNFPVFDAIPSGATIVGIEVQFNRVASPGTTAYTNTVQMLKGLTPVGTPLGPGSDWPTTGLAEPERWGGVYELFLTTWSPSDFQDPGFGFQITVHYDYASGVGRLTATYYQVTVYYNNSGQVLSSDVTDAWAQMAYVGWGVQVWAPTGPSQGIANVYLDGVFISAIDQYTATDEPPTMLLQIEDVSLGMHILKFEVTGTKNSSSSGYTVIFDSLRVMR